MPDQPRTAGFPDGDQAGSTPAERRALDDLFSLIYEELRRLALLVRKDEVNATLNTALVHEAWLKLKDSPPLALKSLPHFKGIAKAMRQVLVDEARRRSARKEAEPERPSSSRSTIQRKRWPPATRNCSHLSAKMNR
jgi:hypothetical protein